MDTIAFAPYVEQEQRWPRQGRHILAHHDDAHVVVYQAYKPAIGRWSAEHGRLGGPGFKRDRMTWIKPNFLWMMYRSGWGTKPDQEVTLGLVLRRDFFDDLLAGAVASSMRASTFETRADWKRALRRSAVRLQWDPDHAPSGAKVERRAVQLGLRGEALERLCGEGTVGILDLSDHVEAQRVVLARDGAEAIETPIEHVYTPRLEGAAANVRLTCWDPVSGAPGS